MPAFSRGQQKSAAIATTLTVVAVATWRYLQWRARRRARETAARIMSMVKNGAPLIDYENEVVRNRIVVQAIRRASKWMSLSAGLERCKPMLGQVGGRTHNRKPVLSLEPDYVLKPLRADHRGIREVAFFEAIQTASAMNVSTHTQSYAAFLTGGELQQHQQQQNHHQKNSNDKSSNKKQTSTTTDALTSLTTKWGDRVDTVALALAMLVGDTVVTESEVAVREGWKRLRREVNALHKLPKFICPYHGVLGQSAVQVSPDTPFGLSNDAYLLLHDVTVHYSKPCAIDLKMGTQTYEPTATQDKKAREYKKYPQQEKYGFRVVASRLYRPAAPTADKDGYVFYPKTHGRSLGSDDELKRAFRTFFSAGCQEHGDSITTDNNNNNNNNNNCTNKQQQQPDDAAAAPSNPVNGSSNNGNDATSTTTRTTATMSPPSGATKTIRRERIRTRVISNLLVQLRPLRSWFDENKSVRFVASSLLIAYEGNVDQPGGHPNVTSVTMIDFGRVRRDITGDPGYCLGLQTLVRVLQDLLQEEQEWLEERGHSHNNHDEQHQRQQGQETASMAAVAAAPS